MELTDVEIKEMLPASLYEGPGINWQQDPKEPLRYTIYITTDTPSPDEIKDIIKVANDKAQGCESFRSSVCRTTIEADQSVDTLEYRD
jgi:hypothetical protein